MNLYEQLVMLSQDNYSKYYHIYASGNAPYKISERQDNYQKQLNEMIKIIKEASCIIIGGASGLSAAGGGDFYYEDNASFRKYFGKFAEKYGIKGAFAGMGYPFKTRNEYWAYLATFLNTTQSAPIREPYYYLNKIIKDKDFFVLTTNQDTQFVKLYDEKKVAQIQGDHRYFQCSQPCHDGLYDAIEPVKQMIAAMKDTTTVSDDLIPRCPHCGKEMFPWVRGYGNLLQGKRYHEEYQKMNNYLTANIDKKILFLELGVGRMTPMFIQEPFWNLTKMLPKSHYISINKDYALLPQEIENQGIAIKEDILKVLKDVVSIMEENDEFRDDQ